MCRSHVLIPANLQECHARRLPDSPPPLSHLPLSPRSAFSPPTHDRPSFLPPLCLLASLSRSYRAQKPDCSFSLHCAFSLPFHGPFTVLQKSSKTRSFLPLCLLACSARVGPAFLLVLLACFVGKLLLNHIIDKLKSLTATGSTLKSTLKSHPVSEES